MNYIENLLIYARNLSPFYIFSMAISIFAVLLTAYFGITGCTATLDDGASSSDGRPPKKATSNNNSSRKQEHSNTTDDSVDEAPSSDSEESADGMHERMHIESLRQLKSAKLKSIEKSLTEEQRKAEKEIERAQLAAIFELLKQQTESSNLDEEDLKEQLSLYR
ncbi:uncharacterized protein LOC131216851 [Anopheles bellator]|uniref:uncharacterized protein LOC131216851 n=1 Tax=Anopheles bellator TaxID=139047 RepID=UPI002649A5D4|nr:uncharacterized protein LOC131216851 [Anopheles bellator]